MAMTQVMYKGLNESGPSPRLWANCPWDDIQANQNMGRVFWDDFIKCPSYIPAAATTGADFVQIGDYLAWVDTTTTPGQITSITQELGGGIILTPGAVGNYEATLLPTRSGAFVKFPTDRSVTRVWFEASIAVDAIADGDADMFVGFSEEAVLGDLLSDTTGTFADKDLFGWHRLGADGDKLDIRYKKAGQTLTTLLADAVTLVAGTFIKVGLLFDRDAAPSQRCTFFTDNVKLTTYLTETQLAAATFPAGEEMTFVASIKTDAAETHTLSMRWWRFAMLY